METRCGGGLAGVGVGEGGDAFGDTDFKSVIDSSKLGGNCVGIGGGICFDINSEGGESTLLIEGYFCLNSFSEVMDEFLECVDWRRSGVAYTSSTNENDELDEDTEACSSVDLSFSFKYVIYSLSQEYNSSMLKLNRFLSTRYFLTYSRKSSD